MREIRLQNSRGLLLENVAEAPLREEALAGRDRNPAFSRDGRHRGRVFRQAGFLEEENAVFLDRLTDLDRHGRTEAAVGVDRESTSGPTAVEPPP